MDSIKSTSRARPSDKEYCRDITFTRNIFKMDALRLTGYAMIVSSVKARREDPDMDGDYATTAAEISLVDETLSKTELSESSIHISL